MKPRKLRDVRLPKGAVRSVGDEGLKGHDACAAGNVVVRRPDNGNIDSHYRTGERLVRAPWSATNHRAIGNEATELPRLRWSVGYHLSAASATVCDRFDDTITLLHHGKCDAEPPEAGPFLDSGGNLKRTGRPVGMSATRTRCDGSARAQSVSGKRVGGVECAGSCVTATEPRTVAWRYE